ncbi:MAG: cache domain-containing protein [Desulfobacterales bacterium]
MNIRCAKCGKDFKIVDPHTLSGDRNRIAFKCSACGHKEPLTKEPGQSWASFFAGRAAPRHAAGETAAPEAKPQAAAPKAAPLPPGKPEAPAAPGKEETVSRIAAATDLLAEETPRRRSAFSGLTGKVALFMLLASLLPLSIYAVVIHFETIQRMERETDHTGRQIVSGLAAQVDEWVDKNLRILQAAADLEAMRSMAPASQEPLLKVIQANYPWKYLVFTVDEAGRNISRSDGNPLTDYADRQYYKDVVHGKKAFSWQTLIGRTTGKPALILAVPIRQGERVVGALCSAMHVEAISDQIAGWRKGKSGLAFLVDQTGKVVAHQDEALARSAKNLSGHPLIAGFKPGGSGMIRFQEGGADKVGFVQATRLNWKVAIEQKEEEVFDLIREAMIFAAALLAATVTLVLLVAFFASRAIVKPIRQLTEAAERISTGDLEVQIAVRSRNEIGELAAAIGRMQESIRIAIERMKRTRGKSPAIGSPKAPGADAVDGL